MNLKKLLIVVAAGATLMLAACSNENKLSWNEEVPLVNGEIVVVQRTARARALGEIGGPGGWEAEAMTVEITSPRKPTDPAVWNFPYVPILFDQDPAGGEWFMVATFYTCEKWYELGTPSLPYGEWRFRGGKWQRVDLSPNLIGRKANLLTAIRSSGEPNHTVKSKEEIMSDRRIAPEYRRIFDGWKPIGCSKGEQAQQKQ